MTSGSIYQGNCLRTDRVCIYFSCHICDMSTWNTVWPEQERALNLLIKHLENLYSATSLHHNTLIKICNIPSQPVMASSEQHIVFKFLSSAIYFVQNYRHWESQQHGVWECYSVFPVALEGMESSTLDTVSMANTRTQELMFPNHPDTVISYQISVEELHMEEFRIKNSYYNVQRNILKNIVLIWRLLLEVFLVYSAVLVLQLMFSTSEFCFGWVHLYGHSLKRCSWWSLWVPCKSEYSVIWHWNILWIILVITLYLSV